MFALKMLSATIDFLKERAVEERRTSVAESKAVNYSFRNSQGVDRNSADFSLHNTSPTSTDPNSCSFASSTDCGTTAATDTSIAIRANIIKRIASIPNFVKTLLLIEDDTERNFTFDLSIIRQVVFSKYSIDSWLISMLQCKQKWVGQRAVNYLQLLSSAEDKEQEHIASNKRKHNGTGNDGDNFHIDDYWEADMRKRHTELYEAVGLLDGLIPSMVGLNEHMIEQVATTQIISRILDKMVLRRFAILVVFFDAIFLAGLIISFRISTLEYLDNSTPDLVLKWIFVTNACIFYLLIRELGKSFSLSMFTGRTFFMEQFWSFWNFVDFFQY